MIIVELLNWYFGADGPAWLRLPLFRVFPQFGAMILNQPFTSQQPSADFSRSAHVLGWIYHFSGPAALARNIALKRLRGERLLRRYDWLYDWRPD